eukprot:g35557.t1
MVSREEVNGQVLHLLQLHGKVRWEGRVMLVVVEWTRMSLREQSLRMQTGRVRGRCVWSGGVLLELSEMAENDLLNADTGAMKEKHIRFTNVLQGRKSAILTWSGLHVT